MAKVEAQKPGSAGDTSKPDFGKVDDKPTGAKVSDDGSAVSIPTTDLPGTDHPNPPATDQQGVKGMEPKSETGTQAESEPNVGQSAR